MTTDVWKQLLVLIVSDWNLRSRTLKGSEVRILFTSFAKTMLSSPEMTAEVCHRDGSIDLGCYYSQYHISYPPLRKEAAEVELKIRNTRLMSLNISRLISMDIWASRQVEFYRATQRLLGRVTTSIYEAFPFMREVPRTQNHSGEVGTPRDLDIPKEVLKSEGAELDGFIGKP